MEKKEMQSIWDNILIDNWYENMPMIKASYEFFDAVDIECHGNDFIGLFDGLGIKRTPSVKSDFYISARAFIGNNCLKMNACLFNKKNTKADIIGAIDLFKWKPKKQSIANAKKATLEKRKKQCASGAKLYVAAREIKSKRQWDVIG